eukprot:TRINITY_DN69267_c0_g1_i1.p1 TRINITY_DN69267_c0_g1~~TRINITY_DN69267_c0_g1_i1.p1  ORF type:complete len:133 (-),score=0.41 TRINITY_DN69267_c0_g1_i1:18-416(-)
MAGRFVADGFRCAGGLAAVALLELVDATLRVDEALRTRVERVRVARDFEQDQRILVAVVQLDLLLARHGRAGQDERAGGRVLEDHRMVRRMNAFLSHRVLQQASPFPAVIAFFMGSRESTRLSRGAPISASP